MRLLDMMIGNCHLVCFVIQKCPVFFQAKGRNLFYKKVIKCGVLKHYDRLQARRNICGPADWSALRTNF